MVEDEKLEKALKKSVLFETVSADEQMALMEIAHKKWLPKNSTLFSEGEAANGFFLIVSGKIKVFKISPDGREHILHIFGSGEPVDI